MDLKLKDVADLLNVSETTIRRWLAEGKIPAYRINHQYRFNRTEIEDWVLGHKLGKETLSPHVMEEENTLKNEEQGTQPSTSTGNKQFSLYRALNKGTVIHRVPGNTKEEVLRTTMKVMAKELDLDADVLTDMLLEREALHPTSLNNGLAIPHARDFLLNAHYDMVTLAFPENPIPYDALDGKPVHTLFFLFACDDKRHLHLLSKIAHLSSHPDTRALLQTKPTKEVFLEYVKNWESQVSSKNN